MMTMPLLPSSMPIRRARVPIMPQQLSISLLFLLVANEVVLLLPLQQQQQQPDVLFVVQAEEAATAQHRHHHPHHYHGGVHLGGGSRHSPSSADSNEKEQKIHKIIVAPSSRDYQPTATAATASSSSHDKDDDDVYWFPPSDHDHEVVPAGGGNSDHHHHHHAGHHHHRHRRSDKPRRQKQHPHRQNGMKNATKAEEATTTTTTTTTETETQQQHRQRRISGSLPRQGVGIVDDSHQQSQVVQQQSTQSPQVQSCGLYLAPSTIPGAGLGVFAGWEYNVDDVVTPGDVVLPLIDMLWHNGPNIDYLENFLWDEYIWAGSTFTGMNEPNHEIDGVSFGIGAAPNCFFPLLNVEDSHDIKRDNGLASSNHHPGIGAYTPFYDRTSHAIVDIPSGMEIYVDYGYEYFSGGRKHLYGLIPHLEDFDIANELLTKYIELNLSSSSSLSMAPALEGIPVGECEGNDKQHDDDHTEEECILEMATTTEDDDEAKKKNNTLLLLAHDVYNVTKKMLEIWPTRTRLALPEEMMDIEHVMANGGTAMKDYNRSIVDMEYLENFGECMDHLLVNDSTIPHAGRGAFAQRFLPVGSVVAPLPLIHLPDRSVLDMYEPGLLDVETGEPTRSLDNKVHSQLLLNYCYGHRDSTLLLCPYGVVSSVVNHAPTSHYNDEHDHPGLLSANVKIVWSDKMTSHPEWREQKIDDWAYKYKAGLGFEYIALRDIAVGEEILVDYGEEWQTAWDEHVKNWHPIERLSDELNRHIDSIIPTEQEWTFRTGDPNIDPEAANLWCYSAYREMRDLPVAENDSYPCKVILRQELESGEYLYTAEIIHRVHNDKKVGHDYCYEEFDEVLWAVPRDAFAYGGQYELDDTREYGYSRSFRHDLRIPDHLMPEVWKNLLHNDDKKPQMEEEELDDEEDEDDYDGTPPATTEEEYEEDSDNEEDDEEEEDDDGVEDTE